MRRPTVVLAPLLVAVAAAACGAPSPSASPSSESTPAASQPGQAGLTATCDDLDLRGPDGQRVDLTGQWTGIGLTAPGTQAWLNQLGDCLFGSIVSGYVTGTDSEETSIVNLDGRIGADFAVDLEHIYVLQDARFRFSEYSTFVMLIEWDDEGRLRLREDREAGETAGYCSQDALNCPAPYLWYPVEAP